MTEQTRDKEWVILDLKSPEPDPLIVSVDFRDDKAAFDKLYELVIEIGDLAEKGLQSPAEQISILQRILDKCREME